MTPEQATAAAIRDRITTGGDTLGDIARDIRDRSGDPEIRPFDLAPGPRVIGLTGAAGSGKSTAAAGLVAQGYTLVKFAAPLKSMLAALFVTQGLAPADIARRIEGDLKEAPDPILGGVSPRLAMQTLGTEWGRDCIARDFWIGLWHRRAAGILDRGGRVVCDDCRFWNETAALRNLGGRVVRITRPDLQSIAAHRSEAGAPADLEVANAATPADLTAVILTALEDPA